MATALTLIAAQQRFINRVNGCHTGHSNRVARAAHKELRSWLVGHGYAQGLSALVKDANDMAELERNADE